MLHLRLDSDAQEEEVVEEMRIWDLHPRILCRQHLLGEHRELHAIWSVLSGNSFGYRNHPETKRWSGKLLALKKRHTLLVNEMKSRGYKHRSPLSDPPVDSIGEQTVYLHTPEQQMEILESKGCNCKVGLL